MALVNGFRLRRYQVLGLINETESQAWIQPTERETVFTW